MNSVTKVLIMAFFILALMYGAYKFGKYFSFQSPVLLRSPFKRVYMYENSRSIEPLTPTPTRKDKPSGAVILPSPTPTPKPQTYYIKSFPKYLTDQGAINRMNILAMAKERYQGNELIAFDNILKKEAGYRPDAVNEIGACGIGQALPCEKMGCPLDQSGLECQFNWVVKYIENRYQGSPIIAWNFHLKNNWY